MENKTCNKCLIEKTITSFRFRKDRNKYSTICIQCINEYRKEWRKNNPEGDIRYLINNKEKLNEINKIWYQNNKEKHLIRSKERYEKNKEKRNKQINDRYKNLLKTNLLARIKHNIRRRLNSAISDNGYTKKSRTMQILGCDFDTFKNYIEAKFESWMNWNNYGGKPSEFNQFWDLDHIIPISSAKDENELYRLSHYTNLQPMCSYQNRYVKRDKISI